MNEILKSPICSLEELIEWAEDKKLDILEIVSIAKDLKEAMDCISSTDDDIQMCIIASSDYIKLELVGSVEVEDTCLEAIASKHNADLYIDQSSDDVRNISFTKTPSTSTPPDPTDSVTAKETQVVSSDEAWASTAVKYAGYGVAVVAAFAVGIFAYNKIKG